MAVEVEREVIVMKSVFVYRLTLTEVNVLVTVTGISIESVIVRVIFLSLREVLMIVSGTIVVFCFKIVLRDTLVIVSRLVTVLGFLLIVDKRVNVSKSVSVTVLVS